MLIRVVKMTFRNEVCDEFEALFRKYKDQIRAAEGCCYLELLREKENSPVFFTYSQWKSEDDLEKYRRSSVFTTVWPLTKSLFAAPAEAWTTEPKEQLA